ncbi:MAG TPA: serine hydrolase [Candidatus Baltobacteraceae bacterium]|nr:serine hydrolase [Candidatus Baltobacteraceae bacterium]
MRRICAIVVMTLLGVSLFPCAARAFGPPAAIRSLRSGLHDLVERFPATSAVEVLDLSSGYRVGYNAAASMPAASTIKVPVMVEVFRQLEAGRFDLTHRMTLLASDKDYGSGDLCDQSPGNTYSVNELLEKMIDISDNTATNMLIRLIGRANINATMRRLGLEHTRLTGDVRTDSYAVRQTLRTSPADMVRLLSLMAKRELVDNWSSNEMISILEEDQINTLLPEPLPDDVPIAHKTGSFSDTLNDVGIVYADDAPYVIAVMTTHLPSLSMGRSFIRSLSSMAFHQEARLAMWRSAVGIATFANGAPGSNSPDIRYWQNPNATESGIGG